MLTHLPSCRFRYSVFLQGQVSEIPVVLFIQGLLNMLLCVSRIEYQLPNLAVGLINKESVNAAFFSGITAEQVISLGGLVLCFQRKTL